MSDLTRNPENKSKTSFLTNHLALDIINEFCLYHHYFEVCIEEKQERQDF